MMLQLNMLQLGQQPCSGAEYRCNIPSQSGHGALSHVPISHAPASNLNSTNGGCGDTCAVLLPRRGHLVAQPSSSCAAAMQQPCSFHGGHWGLQQFTLSA